MIAVLRATLVGLLLLAALLVGLPLHVFGRLIGLPLGDALQLWCCRAMLACVGVRVLAHGRPAAAPRLLVANHVSWIDVLVLGSREPLSFLAKIEVATWPMIASFARQCGTVFVDRRRRRLIPATNRAMARRLSEGRSLLLFPEGTTHDGAWLGRFHTSHLACLRDRLAAEPALERASVQTATLRYSDPAAAWIGDANLVPHLWTILKRPAMTCAVAYGEPIAVGRGQDRKALGRRLAADMDAALRVLATMGGETTEASVTTKEGWRPMPQPAASGLSER